MSKQELRKKYHTIRNKLSKETCRKYSHDVCRHLLSLPTLKEATTIAAYKAIQHEVDLSDFISNCSIAKKQIFYPPFTSENIQNIEVFLV
ncbi:MAG: hypothetical protein HRT90_02805, partial [Candidatus Margulisbacteria bacterium]|nr:hypothetical protein [Candidatus Margulisiibacteriota bacterium]